MRLATHFAQAPGFPEIRALSHGLTLTTGRGTAGHRFSDFRGLLPPWRVWQAVLPPARWQRSSEFRAVPGFPSHRIPFSAGRQRSCASLRIVPLENPMRCIGSSRTTWTTWGRSRPRNPPRLVRRDHLAGCGKTLVFSGVATNVMPNLKADASQIALETLTCLALRLVLPAWAADGHTSPLTHAAPTGLASRFRIRTRLYAPAAKVNTQPTLSIPRCRTFLIRAIVFNRPKHSSVRFLFC